MSWMQLLDILKQGAAEREFYASRPPEACPRCGEPLTSAPDYTSSTGFADVTLACRNDGWSFPRDWTSPGAY